MLKPALVLAATTLLATAAVVPGTADAAAPSVARATATHAAALTAAATVTKYKNCTALNKVYKHGVAVKKGVRDKTSGKRVTTYTVNAKVYAANKGLDRDKDGIACEKR
jgi:hypothetical protein